MRIQIRRRLSFANVTSLLALVFAMSGGAYALSVPRNSVGSAQLKRGAVAHSDIRANAVTALNIKNGTLLSRDFKRGQLPRGPAGPGGPGGPAGPTGPAGPQGPAGGGKTLVWRNIAGDAEATIYSVAGLELRAQCLAGGDVLVFARGALGLENANVSLSGVGTGSVPFFSADNDFDEGNAYDLSPSTFTGAGTLVYRTAGNRVITMTYSLISQPGDACVFAGNVVDS